MLFVLASPATGEPRSDSSGWPDHRGAAMAHGCGLEAAPGEPPRAGCGDRTLGCAATIPSAFSAGRPDGCGGLANAAAAGCCGRGGRLRMGLERTAGGAAGRAPPFGVAERVRGVLPLRALPLPAPAAHGPLASPLPTPCTPAAAATSALAIAMAAHTCNDKYDNNNNNNNNNSYHNIVIL